MTSTGDGATADAVEIYVDADACPVKGEVYRVAERYGTVVHVVANSILAVPPHPLFRRVVVDDGFDAADDWIAARAGPCSIVVTADIQLAGRCLASGAAVIAPNGRAFTADSIGMALATRALMSDLRAMGAASGGPPPMTKRDRSAFLSALDQVIVQKRRARQSALR